MGLRRECVQRCSQEAKESPGCLLQRFPQGQARPLMSPAAAAKQETQAEGGSKEGACAPILQQPLKDKAEREHVCVGRGAAEAAWCHLRDTQKLALNPSEAREAE